MRQHLARTLAVLTLILVPNLSLAADPAKFDLLGFKLGMTADEAERVARASQFTNIRTTVGPSFDQAVALQRRELIRGQDYKGVNLLKAERKDALVQLFFTPTREAPRVFKIELELLPSAGELRKQMLLKFAEPDKRADREWLWGDTEEFFYARAKPYLEFQPSPFSPTAPRPIARFILGDPALQKQSGDAIKAAADRAS